ncbi:1-deoxy-D-xylulose-5-phosphate reductoisomerase, partial [Candidatus Pelagibacter sp.]|nr:1-deoxy-D-xylulose-5-phosphate reductoisomerase [Candidatus Pelagibacter sp.]
ICGWNLIKKELSKNKTKFVPVDSEHFSIWYASKNNFHNIEKIILTASGGPLYKMPVKKFKKVKISQALNHPNWRMGKKISIDSATMMNKVFEIIEAKNIFGVNYNNLSILVHPTSYIHALIKFKTGIICYFIIIKNLCKLI